jgi:hypothetical protein
MVKYVNIALLKFDIKGRCQYQEYIVDAMMINECRVGYGMRIGWKI